MTLFIDIFVAVLRKKTVRELTNIILPEPYHFLMIFRTRIYMDLHGFEVVY